jgi:hypothetical protein
MRGYLIWQGPKFHDAGYEVRAWGVALSCTAKENILGTYLEREIEWKRYHFNESLRTRISTSGGRMMGMTATE